MTRVPTIRVRVPQQQDVPHLGTLEIDGWVTPCTIGAGGLIQASLKREGDKRTPIGVFPLRYGFYDAGTRSDLCKDLFFPFVPMSNEMIWEEDGENYNRLVYVSDGERADERLTRSRDENLFEIVIPIGFNDAVPEAGRGSALFIHAARADMRGTAGCIGVPQDRIPDLVRRLRPGMLIDIDHQEEKRPQAKDDQSPLEVVRFVGLERGPRLIIMGAVHGNETCGPQAIMKAIADCRAGRLSIRRGEVTFVPVANIKAYRQATREGDRNLNRDLREKTIPEDYEDKVGNRICALLRDHDALLDIHSFRGAGEPFIFAGPLDNASEVEPFRFAKQEGQFAAHLGTSVVIHGWLDVYGCFLKERARLGYPNKTISEGVGTTEYMRFSGGYGVTLECGTHDDPAAVNVGYRAILNALAHLELIDAPPPPRALETAIQIVDVILCREEGDRLEGTWKTGDPVPSGATIALRANGEAVTAPSDGYIVFPNANAVPGDGICYFGIDSLRAF
ncbi:L,D-transpeptidase family protein [Microvirga puerhi]|uniref:Succinylglutamate desuccinylase/aspartoacylase family protein n=1 Tax=Microvirga puerhi TaxID=2876078 RepID=A0ABS7VWT9_9HYPH|nr:succinylglutamate desuccinylase/aspartoacylase family protein [Microvirga puerhi]MBZ6079328.1 succinylglutamate desuccinylase/aspartoacylase family protein [Microvirga puerhi]